MGTAVLGSMLQSLLISPHSPLDKAAEAQLDAGGAGTRAGLEFFPNDPSQPRPNIRIERLVPDLRFSDLQGLAGRSSGVRQRSASGGGVCPTAKITHMCSEPYS